MTTDYLNVIIFNEFFSYAAVKDGIVVEKGITPTNGDLFLELSKLLSALSPKSVDIMGAEKTIIKSKSK